MTRDAIDIRAFAEDDLEPIVAFSLRAWGPFFASVQAMRRCGMDIAVVETGGDPGHAPARALYGEVGFTLLPIARYFRLLD